MSEKIENFNKVLMYLISLWRGVSLRKLIKKLWIDPILAESDLQKLFFSVGKPKNTRRNKNDKVEIKYEWSKLDTQVWILTM